jgi:hypothetical protein
VTAFLSRLRVDILPPNEVNGRQIYVLAEDFVVDSNIIGRFTVPAGFRTDFASIPRVLWRALDPEDPCILFPSVAHDFIYSVLGIIDERTFSRDHADRVLEELMAISGASLFQRKAAYKAVSWFGGSHWKQNL